MLDVCVLISYHLMAGEARLICRFIAIIFSVRVIYFIFSRAQMDLFSRSIECSDEQGCLLEEGPDGMRLNIQESVSFPISMIDNDKVST